MAEAILHQFPPAAELPSISPYCWKVQMGLRVCGIPFRTENTLMARRANPAGKLPYLEWDGEGYEDSSNILRQVSARSQGATLWPADPGAASLVDILEDWADESLYWHGVYAKFEDDDGWSYVKPALGATISNGAMRAAAMTMARRDARSKLKAQGLATRSRELVDAELDRHLDALEARITGRAYLVGDSLTAADLSVTAMVGQLTLGLTPSYGRRVARREQLSEYLRRMRAETGDAAGSTGGEDDQAAWGD